MGRVFSFCVRASPSHMPSFVQSSQQTRKPSPAYYMMVVGLLKCNDRLWKQSAGTLPWGAPSDVTRAWCGNNSLTFV